MSKTLTKKALLQKAKARLSGDDSSAAEMFLLAHKLGVVAAEITFHGSGDSGSFDDADLYVSGGKENRRLADRIENSERQWVENPEYTKEHESLADQIRELAEKWVEGTDVDWYNNEGGGGKLDLNFRTGEVSGEVYYYEQVSHTGASDEWNLLDDNEGEDE